METRFMTCLCASTMHDLHMLEPIPGSELFTVVHRDGTKLALADGTVLRFGFNKANMWAKTLDGE
jgi:hypothetical protein